MSDHVQSMRQLHLSEITKRFENGESVAKISKDIPVSQSTIGRWLKEEGYIAKRKGRYPKAMPFRARDIYKRKRSLEKVSEILKVPESKVKEWIEPQRNPILGGEKDPLKIKKKEPKPRKPRKRPLRSWKKSIPKAHRCRKYWKKNEKEYVFQLMKARVPIRKIWYHMRASKKRQRMIWREFGEEGDPPNFPPRSPRPGSPPSAFKEAAKKRKQLIASDERRIAELEQKYEEAQAAIEAQKEEIEALKEKRKEELKALRAAAEQRKAIEAWAAKAKTKLPTPPRTKTRQVLPESYEAKELGLPEGKPLREKKPKEKKPRKGRSIEEWADNREFFTVSNDWADLSDASEDELRLFADFMTREGFPSKVTPSGDQPEAFFKERWPRGIERKWIRATERATDFLEAYQKRKAKLKKEKFSPQTAPEIVRYMASSYDAYRNPELNESQKSAAKKAMKKAWEKAGVIDQAIMFFYMGIAEGNGDPTRKGVERGLAAKRMLTEDAERLAKRLGKKRKRLVDEEEKAEAKRLLEQRKRELLEGKDEG